MIQPDSGPIDPALLDQMIRSQQALTADLQSQDPRYAAYLRRHRADFGLRIQPLGLLEFHRATEELQRLYSTTRLKLGQDPEELRIKTGLRVLRIYELERTLCAS